MVPSHLPGPTDRTCLPLSQRRVSHSLPFQVSKKIVTSPYLYRKRKEKNIDSHLMPMQMPWMTRRTKVVDNNPYSVIRPHVVNIPISICGRKARIPTLRQEQHRVTQVGSKCTIIDSPDDMACRVDREIDIHGHRSVGTSGFDGVHRYSIGERLVEAGGCGVYLGDRSLTRGGVRVCVFIVNDRKSVGLVSGFGAVAGCNV